MKNPVQSLLSRCEVGFYPWQKVALTLLVVAYVGSPVDLLPDLIPFLGWGDDVYVIYLLIRVWASPSLPAPDANGAGIAASSHRQSVSGPHGKVPVVHRDNVGGVS
jgi:uncharacterized membrane protein YkvA (DUF1232 family)